MASEHPPIIANTAMEWRSRARSANATSTSAGRHDAFTICIAHMEGERLALVVEEVTDLFASWCEWCAANGEHAGSKKRFSQCLDGHGLTRTKHPVTRRSCFQGIRLLIRAAPVT